MTRLTENNRRKPMILNLLIKKRKRKYDEFVCEIPTPEYVYFTFSSYFRSIRMAVCLATLAFYCIALAYVLKGRVLAKYIGISMFDSAHSHMSRRNIDTEEFKIQRKILEHSVFSTQSIETTTAVVERSLKVGNMQMTSSSRFIASISPPKLQKKSMSAFGAWMKDPIADNDIVYVMDHYYRNTHVLTYDNEEEFKVDNMSTDFEIPFQWGGTGHSVCDGYIYFNRYNTSTLCKYSLTNRVIVVSKDLPNAAFGNMAPYQWAGSTDIDFSVDSDTLWIIYATPESEWNITIGKINKETLELEKIWMTNYRKRSAANAFLVNGILYVLHRYDSPNTMLNYAFDTTTSTYFWPKIPFQIRFGSLCSLDYNHAERRLYAWDRGHQITYDVTFK